MQNSRFSPFRFFSILAIVFLIQTVAYAQTSTFTYQGKLTDASIPASGIYDFEFALFDAQSGGTQQSTTQTVTATQVTNGIFTVQLDFGANAFLGAERFIEIRVKRPSDPSYTPLIPRVRITSAPYAVRSTSAANADNATSATSFSGNLAGDVSGTQGATVVNSVGGQSAANVANPINQHGDSK
jgi:hypothetical protein